MSVDYVVVPFDAPTREWARECGVPVDGIAAGGRAASLDDLRDAAQGLPGHTFRMPQREARFEIAVESERFETFPCDGDYRNTIAPGLAIAPAASLHMTGGIQVDGRIESMGFHGDYGLLVAIVQRLTRRCGPQVIVADNEGLPWVVASPEAPPLGPIAR